jgi:hypothetical protein
VGAGVRSDGVLWFEVDPHAGTEGVLQALSPSCPGITTEMVGNLLSPDHEPRGESYGDGGIRIASSFRVDARRPEGEARRGHARHAGTLLFEPVELLAGDGWLASCWHPRREFHGADECETRPARGGTQEVFDHIAQRWTAGFGRSAGDLGVLLLHELALSYRPTARALYSWLEDWELGLYVSDGSETDVDTLAQLWGEMAVFRGWLNPLNRAGLRTNIARAWLPATDLELVVQVDDRVDKTLKDLRELANTLRSSFSVLHVQQAQDDRERSDHLRRRIEVMAAAFLIPTLIVGFYGANTWVPGQGQHWGFWAMVIALVLFGLGGVGVVLYWHHQQRKDLEAIKAERRRLRAQLLSEPRRAA